MFVLKVKLMPSKRMFLVCGAIIAAIVLVCVICSASAAGRTPDTATCDEAGEYSLSAANEQEQIDFLGNFGLEADRLVSADNITIPSEFNSVYDDYNELQRQIGLDLSRYKGENAEKYVYALKGENADFAVILVKNNRVIGGHLTSGEFGEENRPLIE